MNGGTAGLDWDDLDQLLLRELEIQALRDQLHQAPQQQTVHGTPPPDHR